MAGQPEAPIIDGGIFVERREPGEPPGDKVEAHRSDPGGRWEKSGKVDQDGQSVPLDG
jgi:hypothetical protein